MNYLNLEPTLCPNIIVLAVSPLCRGDGPIVMTSEVLAVPVKKFRCQTHTAQIWFIKFEDASQFQQNVYFIISRIYNESIYLWIL